MNKNTKSTTIVVHILVWVVLFTLPFLLYSNSEVPKLDRLLRFNFIPLVMYAIIFYLNYFFLVDKFFLTKRFVFFVGINLGLFISLFFFKQYLTDEVLAPPSMSELPRRSPPPRRFLFYIDTLSFVLPLICAIAIKIGQRWLRVEAEKKENENAKLQSELEHLKYQLQPHFFFNSLNNIYSLVDISPEQAKETIHSLGKLMRYLLYESNTEKVELKKEIEFLDKYIDLMKLRSSANVTITSDFANVSPSVKIAPLLFISLIENAFKHGVSAVAKSNLEFSLKLENGVVTFHSKNTNFPKTSVDKSGSGIGLENLKKRLSLLYPEKHILEIVNKEEAYQVNLIIQL